MSLSSTSLPAAETPLYNHSLLAIEVWLAQQGCHQDEENRNCWRVTRETWSADLELDVEQIVVAYQHQSGDRPHIQRSFPYSLSRRDLEDAIFAGP